MKNLCFKFLAILLCLSFIFQMGCKHTCKFDQKVVSDQTVCQTSTCKSKATYYYSCSCGNVGEETFESGYKAPHSFTAERATIEYLKTPATCSTPAEYYNSCIYCGITYNKTFFKQEYAPCDFSAQNVSNEYLKTEATTTESATFYYSCSKCGKKGEDYFIYGTPIRTDYTDAEKQTYTPTSLTVTLYDTANAVYGFTFNTKAQPLRPVIQIAKGSSFTEYQEYSLRFTKASSYNVNDTSFSYYISKTEIDLEPNSSYVYRAYDKYVGVGTELATFTTKDATANTFSFAHVSDTQNYPNFFANVLENTVGTVDFILHTGDVVETSKYESEWTDMLNGNFKYLSKIPVMAISGNHETTYKNGSNETFKHFHNNIPTQSSTLLGYFYSFIYGNVKFIMLNTNDLSGNELKKEQFDWLVDELKNNVCAWTIVAMHNPVYSAGKWGSDASRNTISLALRSQLNELFANYGVDLVLQGHDHVVSQTYPIDSNGQPQAETKQTISSVDYVLNPNGVIYLTNGTSGGQNSNALYVNDTNQHLYSYTSTSQKATWAEFVISDDAITIYLKYANGTSVITQKSWGIKKTTA